MLDPNLCPRTTTKWVELSWKFSHLLSKPVNFPFKALWIVLLIGIIGLVVFAIRNPKWRRQIFRQRRWQRRWTQVTIILTVIGLLVTSPPGLALATQALVRMVPSTSNAPSADAIVVLGRGARFEGSRTETAVALWQAKQAPKIFVSGHGDAARLVKKLEGEGIPRQALDGDDCSLTTEENARFAANILMPQGVKRIILVTDPPHMLRSLLTFQSQGFTVFPHPSPLPNTLSYREKLIITFREYGGLISYLLKGRIFDKQA
jgi:uncharacterized SAM-binding protein YcdF (DUF218 family)